MLQIVNTTIKSHSQLQAMVFYNQLTQSTKKGKTDKKSRCDKKGLLRKILVALFYVPKIDHIALYNCEYI